MISDGGILLRITRGILRVIAALTPDGAFTSPRFDTIDITVDEPLVMNLEWLSASTGSMYMPNSSSVRTDPDRR